MKKIDLVIFGNDGKLISKYLENYVGKEYVSPHSSSQKKIIYNKESYHLDLYRIEMGNKFSIDDLYIKNAQGIVLVFDLKNESFPNLIEILEKIFNVRLSYDFPLILVGCNGENQKIIVFFLFSSYK